MMKNLALLLASLFVAASLPAATMAVNSGVAPTIDGEDIASLSGLVDIGGDVGHVWGNRARQGQTFTTGSNPGGYSLDAYTIRVRVDQGSTSANTWNIRVGTMAGAILNVTAAETATGVAIGQSTAANNFPSYITWTLDNPVTLLPNTVYGIDVDTNGQGGGFISLNNDTDPYPGGSALTSPGVGNAFGPQLSTGADRHFHLNITAIPEPSSTVLGLGCLALLLRRRRR